MTQAPWFNTTPHISSGFCGWEFQPCKAGFPAQGLTRQTSRHWLGWALTLIPRLWGWGWGWGGCGRGGSCFPAHAGCWQNSVLHRCRSDVTASLLATSQGRLSLPRASHIPCHVGPSKSATVWKNLFCASNLWLPLLWAAIKTLLFCCCCFEGLMWSDQAHLKGNLPFSKWTVPQNAT